MTAPGTTIAGRYRVLDQLGQGSMGSVWLAHDTALNRDVAVKSVRGPLVEARTGGTEGAQRAMREARLIARVNHPNAVAIFDVVTHEGHPWLVMEYVPSRNLSQVIGERGTLKPHGAAVLGAQLASALADAHRAGIVHRDVKPANVLISEQGQAKITDFGIARGHDDVTLTATGMTWGTPAYFAPEVASGHSATHKADVWSLGATLYFAVEGSPPYGTDSGALVLMGRIAQQPVPPPQRAGTLTPVLERLLDRDPVSRPTMTEAAEMLAARVAPHDAGRPVEALATAPQAPDDSPTRTTPVGGGEGAARRRSGVLAVLLAVAGVVALGALAWSLLGPDGDGGTVAVERTPSQSAAPSQPESPRETPRESARPSPQPSQRSERPEQPENRRQAAGPFTPAAMEQTVSRYYAIMPADTETGFDLLGPSLRAQGYGSYQQFWNGIESVSVRDVQASPAGRSVTATVVFVTEDGRTSTERHRFGLVPNASGDGLLIDTDTVIG